jgi:hypothetical protein
VLELKRFRDRITCRSAQVRGRAGDVTRAGVTSSADGANNAEAITSFAVSAARKHPSANKTTFAVHVNTEPIVVARSLLC